MTNSMTRLAGYAVLATALAVPAFAQTAPKATSPDASTMQSTQPMKPAGAMPTTPSTAAIASADDMQMTGGDRASKIIGSGVMNEAKETVGTVDDLIVTPDNKVPVAVLSVGGFLGIGTKYVAVPFSDLKVTEKGVTMPGATKESLKSLPAFAYRG
jgi:hypothetical protein